MSTSTVEIMPGLTEQQLMAMLPCDARERVQRFLEAGRLASNPDFRGLVLMSLLVYSTDELVDEAIDDALTTVGQVKKGAANA